MKKIFLFLTICVMFFSSNFLNTKALSGEITHNEILLPYNDNIEMQNKIVMTKLIQEALFGGCAIYKEGDEETFLPHYIENSCCIGLFNKSGEQIGITVLEIKSNICHINYFSIDSLYRNQGLGKKFLNAIMREFEGATFELTPSSESAEQFYIKLGFEKVPKSNSKLHRLPK